jgi:hypothetical protein
MGALELALLIPSALALVALSLYRLRARRVPRRERLPVPPDVWANYQREILRESARRRAS